MNALLILSLITVGQLELKSGDKVVRLSSEGLLFKNAEKEVTLAGVGATGKKDGGTAFTGIAQTVKHTCSAGENIDLSGTSNDLTLSGPCGVVTVSGLGHDVTVETAASIDVSGKNNTVMWTKGDPKVKGASASNRVFKQ